MAKIRELETIYKIFDSGDSNYTCWYGTADDIIDYVEEHKEDIPNYDNIGGFIDKLEKLGLTFEFIN